MVNGFLVIHFVFGVLSGFLDFLWDFDDTFNMLGCGLIEQKFKVVMA